MKLFVFSVRAVGKALVSTRDMIEKRSKRNVIEE